MIDLSGAASGDPKNVELVERKLCEGWKCGQYFYRRRPATAREGERLCAKCKDREQWDCMAAGRESSKTRGLNARCKAEVVLGSGQPGRIQ